MKTAALFLLLCLTVPAFAQDHPNAGQNYAGFDLGATYNWYTAPKNFSWSMQQQITDEFGLPHTIHSFAEFHGMGSGLGLVAGGKIGFGLGSMFDLEAKIRYLTNYTSNSENDSIPIDLIDEFGNPSSKLEPVSNNYNLRLDNLDFDALLHAGIGDNLYLAAGFSMSLLVSNHLYVNQKKNGGDDWSYYNAGTSSVSGDTEITVDGSQSKMFNSSRLGL